MGRIKAYTDEDVDIAVSGIHYEFMRDGKHHGGIIVAKQVSVGETVRGLLHLVSTLSAEDMEDRLEYLSNW